MKMPARQRLECAQRRTEEQRCEQQEAERQNQRDRQQPAAQIVPVPAAAPDRHAPNLVQAGFQLHQGRIGAEQQRHDTDRRGHDPRYRPMGSQQHCLHLGRRLRPDKIADLLMDLAPRGALAEEEPCNYNGKQKNRPEREYGVKGERRADAGRAMVAPAVGRVLDQGPDLSGAPAEPGRNVEHTDGRATVVPQLLNRSAVSAYSPTARAPTQPTRATDGSIPAENYPTSRRAPGRTPRRRGRDRWRSGTPGRKPAGPP